MRQISEEEVDKFIQELNGIMEKYDLRILSADMMGIVVCPAEEFELRVKIHFKLKKITTKELLSYII